MGSFAADFTAPDSTLLSDYTASDGTTFAAHASYGGHFYVLSNRATTPSGGSGALSMASWTPASADYSVTAGMYISTTQVSRSGPAFRIQPGSATFYYTRFRAGLIELMRVVNGTQSPAGSATYSIASRVGTTPIVTIAGVGGSISVTIDGTLMFTATGETLIPGAGSAGMYWDNGTVGDATGQLIADLAGEDAGGGGVTLALADASHAHAAESPALVQANVLVVQDATHAHAAEAPALSLAFQLTPADALLAHAAESLALVLAGQLGVQSALHAHAAERPSLAASWLLAVADALHAQTADGLLALTTAQVVHGYLTGRVRIAPALSGVVAVRPALTGTLTLTPANR